MEKQDQQNRDQGYGIAALVIGVFAILFSFIPCIGLISIILGILAIIFGSMAFSRAQQAGTAKGSAIAGITLGGLAMIITTFWIVFLLGAKDKFKDKFESRFEQFQYWSDDMEDFEDNFEDLESLDDLEDALDELESSIDNIDDSVKKNVEIELNIKVDRDREE